MHNMAIDELLTLANNSQLNPLEQALFKFLCVYRDKENESFSEDNETIENLESEVRALERDISDADKEIDMLKAKLTFLKDSNILSHMRALTKTMDVLIGKMEDV